VEIPSGKDGPRFAIYIPNFFRFDLLGNLLSLEKKGIVGDGVEFRFDFFVLF
jgi:hypothetical protein